MPGPLSQKIAGVVRRDVRDETKKSAVTSETLQTDLPDKVDVARNVLAACGCSTVPKEKAAP